LEDRAKGIRLTIGQGVTIALDKLGLKFKELNEAVGGTERVIGILERFTTVVENVSKAVKDAAESNAYKKFINFYDELANKQSFLGRIFQDSKNIVFSTLPGVSQLIRLYNHLSTTTEEKVTNRVVFLNEAIEKQKEIIADLEGRTKGWLSVSDKNSLVYAKERLAKYTEELKVASVEMDKIGKKSKDAKPPGQALADAVKQLARIAPKTLKDFNREFSTGEISVNNYRKAVERLSVEKLKKDFAEGKIEAAKFTEELIKTQDATLKLAEKFQPGSALFVGTSNYIKEAGTLASNIASAVTGVFNRLEDYMLEFIRKGEFNFRKFSQAVIEDINRIIVRTLIVKPLADAVLNLVPTGTTEEPGAATSVGTAAGGGSFATPQVAHGGVFESGVKAFQSGGIVNAPTFFRYNGSRKGLMGEAGPEAILPLRKTPRGDLGVATIGNGGDTKVTVNVINQSGADVQTSERQGEDGTKVLDIIINRKIQENFATGRLDRTLNTLYGTQRKGH